MSASTWRRVFNVAYKFVGRHDEAEDLTQDVFLKVFKSLATFDRRANFQTWLVSVSRNLCIDHYRSVRKERETIDRDVNADDLSPHSVEVSAHVVLERLDLAQELRRALQLLPESLRTAVVMRDIQELSYQEIADRLAAAGRDRQVAHQPGPPRTCAPDYASQREGPRVASGRREGRQPFWSMSMKLTIDHVRDIAVVRVAESRLMYPLLSDFSAAVVGLIGAGTRKVIVDLAPVVYIDSATIGCLMDLYRQAAAAGGALKLAGVQKRVETMLTMTGAHNFIQLFADEATRAGQFRRVAMRTIKTTTGARDPPRRRPAHRHGNALPRGDRPPGARAVVRGHGAGNRPPGRPDDAEERDTYLQESLFLNSVTYENESLGAYMRKLAEEEK